MVKIKTNQPVLTDKPTAISLAQVLAQANPTNVDAALEEVAKAYNVIVESSDGMLIRFLEYGKLTNIVAKLRSALPVGSYSQYRVHIIESDSEKLAWEIEPKGSFSYDVFTLIRYKKKSHWWNREPRAKWKVVLAYNAARTINQLYAKGYVVLGANDFQLSEALASDADLTWIANLKLILTEALNGYTTEE